MTLQISEEVKSTFCCIKKRVTLRNVSYLPDLPKLRGVWVGNMVRDLIRSAPRSNRTQLKLKLK